MNARKKPARQSARKDRDSPSGSGSGGHDARGADSVGEPSRTSGHGQSQSSPRKSSGGRKQSANAFAPYPYEKPLPRKEYEDQLRTLQIELLKVQSWARETGRKIAVIFEGRDAAGKGGTIKRFTEHLNPRGSRVIALSKPNETELGQWYFQRYVNELPTRGEISFWDRSWYNRAGVEPVMGFCSPSDYQRFMHQVPGFENALIESGLLLFKLWFDVSREQQAERIRARERDPLKRWKLSPMDYESMARFDEYTKARDAMFLQTDLEESPWFVVRSDDKRRARINAMLLVLSRLSYPDRLPEIDAGPDPLIVGRASDMLPMEGRLIFDVEPHPGQTH